MKLEFWRGEGQVWATVSLPPELEDRTARARWVEEKPYWTAEDLRRIADDLDRRNAK
jgi:hypothetical protein